MTTPMAGPGPIRLQREAVRIVSIPYANPFAKTYENNLITTVAKGMGLDDIVKKRTLKLRLQAPGVGRWQCPRRSDGHRGKRVHLLPSKEAPKFPGYCEIEYLGGPSGKCGRKLEVEETHRHEMAEAFGFLESKGDSYIHGKFGLLAKFLEELSPPSYFDLDNARMGLFIDSLLEHHADLVLPVLWIADNPGNYGPSWINDVLHIFRTCLQAKKETLSEQNPSVRGTINLTHLGAGLLRKAAADKLTAFADSQLENRRDKRRSMTRAENRRGKNQNLEKKVQDFYVTRTVTYLKDLGLITAISRRTKGYRLTDRGRNLIAALKMHGFMTSEGTCHMPPGFEAIHDVMSIGYDQYNSWFYPPISRRVMERILMRCVLPTVEPVEWERYRSDLAGILPAVVRSVGNKVNAGARIDTVRNAVFLYQLGRGIPTLLEEKHQEDADTVSNLRRNAIVSLAADETDKYLLGSARVGKRLWSINLLRNPTYGA